MCNSANARWSNRGPTDNPTKELQKEGEGENMGS